jgi:hypothetical protein
MKRFISAVLLALFAFACTPSPVTKQLPSVRTGPGKDPIMVNFTRSFNEVAAKPSAFAPRATLGAPWYTAYYASWNQEALGSSSWNYETLGQTPADVDWTGVTHVVHFGNGNISTTSPYFDCATKGTSAYTELFYGAQGATNVNYVQLLTSTIHGLGKKVVVSLQAVDPTGLNLVAADPAKITLFSNTVASFCKTNNYDGVEIDWEGSKSGNAGNLIHGLRTALDAALGTHALILLSPGVYDADFYPASADADVDQYNPQFYAMMWNPNDNNLTWHECAVYASTATGGTQAALDNMSDGSQSFYNRWIAIHDKAKVGALLPTFGYIVKGANGLFQSISGGVIGHNGNMTVDQNKFCTGLLSIGGVAMWDSVRKAPYITGTATKAYPGPNGGIAKGQKFFATYVTPQQVQEWVKWGQSKNLPGYSLYSLTEDLDPSKAAGKGRNLVHDAMRDALGGVVNPPPPIAPTGTLTATPTTLPFGGGTVTLAWTSANASTATLNGNAVALGGNQTATISTTSTWTLALSGTGGSQNYTATTTVAPQNPPPPGTCNFDSVRAYWQPIYLAQGAASVHIPDSAKIYAAGKASVICPPVGSQDSTAIKLLKTLKNTFDTYDAYQQAH